MISCTEFIPSYSELFTYLDDHYGHEEVERFWDYLFAPTGDGIPLINYAKRDGIRGCWNYSNKTLSEEAADCTRYFNEKAGWAYSIMHYCPSKGRLLEMEKEIGVKPYYDYCTHCNYYRSHLEAVGLKYLRFNVHVDEASCANLIYDPKIFKGMLVKDENTEILEIRSRDKEYFHPDFHSSLNMGLEYLGSKYGEEILVDYLSLFTRRVYQKVIKAMQADPLGALEAKIKDTYKAEKCEDALEITNDGSKLSVKILYCPAVRHLKKTGRVVSKWMPYSTSVVMQTLAEDSGIQFTMESYDHETGAASYSFTR